MEKSAISDGRPNYLRSALTAGEFVYTAELVLGRDHSAQEAEEFVKEASQQADGIKIVSLTDLPGGNPALPPESFVTYVSEHKLTPIAHLSGKDGNRSLLEARLHGLARLGVENIIALTGDAQKHALGGKSKPVYDLDSVLILCLIAAMRNEVESKNAAQDRATGSDFFPGAVVNPYKVREADLLMQLYKLRLKVAAGAQFIIPQLGYNLRKLYELKQYMAKEGLAHIPVLANVYVPTARIARMMQNGEIAGCVISDDFIQRVEREKKPQRLERAALMAAAARELGFAGAHVGGFGLSHRDFMTIIERAAVIGTGWRGRIDELMFPWSREFYLFPPGRDGLSDGVANYQLSPAEYHSTTFQRISEMAYRHLIAQDSQVAKFFRNRLQATEIANGRDGFWCRLLAPSIVYRKATLGCVSCGDCVQDHLNYAGCSMRWCYKELRNGPCGGSRVDGSCEVHPELPCIWNLVYSATRAMGKDPETFAHTLIPPRNWDLDRSNALVNRFREVDNFRGRVDLKKSRKEDA